MIAPPAARCYGNGRVYKSAQGRDAPRPAVVDQLAVSAAVVDLDARQPSAAEFVQAIVREMRIRFYKQKTIRSYRRLLVHFLRWFGGAPRLVTREDVRSWLEAVVLGGASSSTVSNHLSAIRTAFDKMCGRSVTFGLQTPRRAKRLPVVLSEKEVRRILEAAPSLRDKLLLGLLYATGMRVSEVVRLRWRDVDFDRRRISIWQEVESPLDRMTRRSRGEGQGSREVKPVGRMRIDLKRLLGNEAESTVAIVGKEDVLLSGIRGRQPRPGWVTLDIPPLEHWEPALLQLPREQRERIESPEFYERLQRAISAKYLAGNPPG